MKLQSRKAVSPIIATLLLIAIAVASGVIVYVFTSGLAGNLTKSGGAQVTDQVSLDAYNFQTATAPTLYLRNTGTSSVTISSVYFDGSLCASGGAICTAAPTFATGGTGQCAAGPICSAGQTTTLTLTVTSQTSGSSHAVKVVTADGGSFTFNLVVGSTG